MNSRYCDYRGPNICCATSVPSPSSIPRPAAAAAFAPARLQPVKEASHGVFGVAGGIDTGGRGLTPNHRSCATASWTSGGKLGSFLNSAALALAIWSAYHVSRAASSRRRSAISCPYACIFAVSIRCFLRASALPQPAPAPRVATNASAGSLLRTVDAPAPAPGVPCRFAAGRSLADPCGFLSSDSSGNSAASPAPPAPPSAAPRSILRRIFSRSAPSSQLSRPSRAAPPPAPSRPHPPGPRDDSHPPP